MFFLKFNFRVSDKAVKELHSKWKKDGTARDMHAARSGRPVTARTSANVQKVRDEIESDKNISISRISCATLKLNFRKNIRLVLPFELVFIIDSTINWRCSIDKRPPAIVHVLYIYRLTLLPKTSRSGWGCILTKHTSPLFKMSLGRTFYLA